MKQSNSTTKLRWAILFPYPISWLRALGLFLLLNGVVAILTIVVYWGLPISWILSKLQQDPTPIIIFLAAVGFVMPVSLISFVHYIFFGKSRPRWLPKLKSLWIGFYSWIVIIVSTFVSLGIVIPFIDKYPLSYYKYPLSYYKSNYFRLTDAELLWVNGIWLVTAAYLYHSEYLLKRRLIANIKKTPRPSAGSQPRE